MYSINTRIIAFALLLSQLLTSCDTSNLKKGDCNHTIKTCSAPGTPGHAPIDSPNSSTSSLDHAATEFSNYQHSIQRETEARLSTRFNLDDKLKEEHSRIDEDQKRRIQSERKDREESYKAFLDKYPKVREIDLYKEAQKEKEKRKEQELYKKYGENWKIKHMEEGFRKSKESHKQDLQQQDKGIEQEIGKSFYDTGKTFLVDLPILLGELGIKGAESLVKWEDKLGAKRGCTNLGKACKGLFGQTKQDWQDKKR